MPDDDRGISCPSCGCRHCPESKHEVAQTFPLGPRKSVRRIRVCRHCGRRFSTYERTAEPMTTRIQAAEDS